MACVSALAPGEWLAAIAAADVARISAIPGIGKKTAQRIILELTGKLGVETEDARGLDRASAPTWSPGWSTSAIPPRPPARPSGAC